MCMSFYEMYQDFVRKNMVEYHSTTDENKKIQIIANIMEMKHDLIEFGNEQRRLADILQEIKEISQKTIRRC